jgi:peptidoglycan/LPS O-acetylase OafA/YrhL
MEFRKDINGLRALAVISVVIFHFNPNSLTGGFIGVDIFFVISGFLMTSIILRGLDSKQFSIVRFYLARFKRIVPALAFLCFVLLVFGYFNLLNIEYQALARHIGDSLLFISNHTYWNEAGYFDADSHQKWLLHTWSLSVEWQFYLIYPLVLMGLYHALGASICKWVILVGAILGFIFCVVMSFLAVDAAYFLLPTRAWQMLCGGLVYLYPIHKLRNNQVVAYIGLFILLACFWLISDDVMWPGYMSLIPILATMLVMQSQNQDNLVLTHPVSQHIGKWSYSIYLWHWPVVVFTSNFIDQVNLWVVFIGMTTSTLLGALSFHLIEKNHHFKTYTLGFVTTVALAAFVFDRKGIIDPIRPISMSASNEFISQYQGYNFTRKHEFDYGAECAVSRFFSRNKQFSVADECIEKNVTGGIFLWGDSHMGALAVGLRKLIDENTPIYQITSSGCPSSFEIKQGNFSRLRQACDKANALALQTIKAVVPDTVIIANKDKHEELDWAQTARMLTKIGVKQIVVVGLVPQWYPSLPIVYSKGDLNREFLTSNKLDRNVVKTNLLMSQLTQGIPMLSYIDVLGQLCVPVDLNMKCKVLINEELIAWDYGHLTDSGSDYVARNFVLPQLTSVQ